LPVRGSSASEATVPNITHSVELVEADRSAGTPASAHRRFEGSSQVSDGTPVSAAGGMARALQQMASKQNSARGGAGALNVPRNARGCAPGIAASKLDQHALSIAAASCPSLPSRQRSKAKGAPKVPPEPHHHHKKIKALLKDTNGNAPTNELQELAKKLQISNGTMVVEEVKPEPAEKLCPSFMDDLRSAAKQSMVRIQVIPAERPATPVPEPSAALVGIVRNISNLSTPKKMEHLSMSPRELRAASSDPREMPDRIFSKGTPDRNSSKEKGPATPRGFSTARYETRCGIFRRLQNDGEFHKERLAEALPFTGFPKPNPEWVSEAALSVTPYSTMDLDEFVLIMEEYEVREHNFAKKLFIEFDTDANGTMDLEEMSVLFESLGFAPMTHVILDIIREIEPEDPDELSFDEFWQVMLHLRINEGFTRAEVRRFTELFETFDGDGSGELESQELTRIVVYLGHHLEPKVTASILSEVDVNGNGSLDSREFLMCMRKVREYEVADMQRVFAECDDDGSGGIGSDELFHVLRVLGYFPEQEEVDDALADIAISGDPDELNFDELWCFLEVFRGREGFSKKDMAEITEVFTRADIDGSGQLEVIELGRLFSMLGCTISVNQAQRFVSNVDIDGSGTIDLKEFTKVMRQMSQHLLQKAKKVLNEDGRQGRASIVEVLQGLVPTAHHKDADKVAVSLADLEHKQGEMDTFEFVSHINQLRKTTNVHVKKNHGFGHAEVHSMRKQFACYDSDKKGFLNDQEVQKLLEDMYPHLTTTKNVECRQQMQEIMKDSHKGNTDFRAFLKLVRMFHGLMDREKVKMERETINQTGFTEIEVNEFRELFVGGTDRETMSLPQLLEMIAPLVPMGEKNATALAELYLEVVGGKDAGREGAEAEFSDFLLLFRRMLDLNIGSINENTRGMAAPR